MHFISYTPAFSQKHFFKNTSLLIIIQSNSVSWFPFFEPRGYHLVLVFQTEEHVKWLAPLLFSNTVCFQAIAHQLQCLSANHFRFLLPIPLKTMFFIKTARNVILF